MPLTVKFLKDYKNFWRAALTKLNEIKVKYKIFEEIYNKRKTLYENLAK